MLLLFFILFLLRTSPRIFLGLRVRHTQRGACTLDTPFPFSYSQVSFCAPPPDPILPEGAPGKKKPACVLLPPFFLTPECVAHALRALPPPLSVPLARVSGYAYFGPSFSLFISFRGVSRSSVSDVRPCIRGLLGRILSGGCAGKKPECAERSTVQKTLG